MQAAVYRDGDRRSCYCLGWMKKRLRKKKRVGEFQELCFELRAELAPGLTNDELTAFVARLIDVVEARQLSFGGGAGCDHRLNGVVTRDGRASATEDDRVALAAFLDSDAVVVRHEIGALQDAWYGSH